MTLAAEVSLEARYYSKQASSTEVASEARRAAHDTKRDQKRDISSHGLHWWAWLRLPCMDPSFQARLDLDALEVDAGHYKHVHVTWSLHVPLY